VPVVLVIIILVAWAVILGPGLLKRRARSGGDQSITHFHHQLRILEHSAPEPIVAPAYRLRAVDGNGTPTGITYPDSGTPPKLTVVGAKELPRPALAFLGEPTTDGDAFEPVGAAAARSPRSESDRDDGGDVGLTVVGRTRAVHDGWVPTVPTPTDHDDTFRADAFRAEGHARRQARRRRRDTLSVLAAGFAVTLLVAAATGASAVWALCGLDAVALIAYVALLVHLRGMAVERERKLHYLDGRDGRDGRRPVTDGGLPTYVSGRYAPPSSQRAVAH